MNAAPPRALRRCLRPPPGRGSFTEQLLVCRSNPQFGIKLYCVYGQQMGIVGAVDDMPSPTPTAAAVRPTRSMWAVVAGTTVLNLAMLPAHHVLWLVILFSTGSTDSSGRGGPFHSCTADSVACDGPIYGLIIVSSVVMLALCFVGALMGYRFGRCRPGRHTLLLLTVLSVFVTIAGTVILIGRTILG